MIRLRPKLFRGRHFQDEIILLCVRWYLRYSLSYRDLEEMMAERGLTVDHVTVWRWVQHYAPILSQRVRGEGRHPVASPQCAWVLERPGGQEDGFEAEVLRTSRRARLRDQ